MKISLHFNKKARVLQLLLVIICILTIAPATAYADPDVPTYNIDYAYANDTFEKVSICSDLHLKGQGFQNNRPRFEAYLQGIQGFQPELIILCGDQFEGNYIPPEAGDYSEEAEAEIGIDFDDPYTEIRALVNYYHQDVPIIFICGNNDYTDENYPDGSYQEFSGYDSHFGLIVTKGFDIFRFGAPDEGYPDYPYSDNQIEALEYYLKNRTDKTKPVFVAGHYPLDDDKNTPTNGSNSTRNAENADEIIEIIDKYDQPIIFLWGHNHDNGPEMKKHILKSYPRDMGSYYVYNTLNAGGVAYRETEDYAQGVDLILEDLGDDSIDYSVKRYFVVDGEEDTILSSGRFSLVSEVPWEGTGTYSNPYKISEAGHLIYLANSVNNGNDYSGKYFKQTKDIDLSGINWVPIGKYVSSDFPASDSNRSFSGTYDGDGNLISNLGISINEEGTPSSNKAYGLFGYLTGEVKNLGLTNVDIFVGIRGNYNVYAGGLVGYAGYYDGSTGYVYNSFVEGKVHAKAFDDFSDQRCDAGGLVGYLRGGEIKYSYSAVESGIEGGDVNSGAGGISGWLNEGATIADSFWNTDLTTKAYGNAGDGTEGGMNESSMKDSAFADTLTEKASNALPVPYRLWMSDEHTNLNNGYPIHIRAITPTITTDPEEVTAVGNKEKVTVTLASVAGAKLYYTTDGSDPKTSATKLEYTAAFEVKTTNENGETITVKAIAYLESEDEYSGVKSKTVTFVKGDTGGGIIGGGGGGGEIMLPLEIVISELPEGTVDLEYLLQLEAKGGSGEYKWELKGLPSGLTMSVDGRISGIPDKPGRFTIDITVTDSKDKKATAKLILNIVEATQMLPKFSDIEGHWAGDSIIKASVMGFVNGYIDGTFKPNRTVTRAEFITMIVKVLKLDGASDKTWEDISNHWAKNSIQIAAYHGIVDGFNDAQFMPDEIITREQLASILVRSLKMEIIQGKTEFKDKEKISGWAVANVHTAVEGGLLKGYPDNTFRPGNSATRAEAIEAILNAISKPSR